MQTSALTQDWKDTPQIFSVENGMQPERGALPVPNLLGGNHAKSLDLHERPAGAFLAEILNVFNRRRDAATDWTRICSYLRTWFTKFDAQRRTHNVITWSCSYQPPPTGGPLPPREALMLMFTQVYKEDLPQLRQQSREKKQQVGSLKRQKGPEQGLRLQFVHGYVPSFPSICNVISHGWNECFMWFNVWVLESSYPLKTCR